MERLALLPCSSGQRRREPCRLPYFPSDRQRERLDLCFPLIEKRGEHLAFAFLLQRWEEKALPSSCLCERIALCTILLSYLALQRERRSKPSSRQGKRALPSAFF